MQYFNSFQLQFFDKAAMSYFLLFNNVKNTNARLVGALTTEKMNNALSNKMD